MSRDSMHGWSFYDDQHDVACTNAAVCGLVQGPTGTPRGSGSAELATNSTSEGPAIVLPDYGGTRFDRITQLRYSAYRQSTDAGDNLAIALQFNVDYDLNDQNASWQGRMVFEPYQGAGGNVAGNRWTSWDAKAGRWWGTKASVPVNGVLVANPCVQATPCTWSQLLTRFPNLGVHAVYGAVVLKAGSGWPNFRGNVDSLAIGVDGVSTVFNFEVSSTPATARLRTRLENGVVGTRVPSDTTYALGSTVPYAFEAAPGHDSLVVVIDGAFAPASGTLVMDRPHTLEAEADSIYTIAGETEDEAAIGQRVGELLAASDKPAAYFDIVQYLLDRVAAGANIDALQRSAEVAWSLAADPVQDSAALDAVDAALDGYTVSLQPTEWGETLASLEPPVGGLNEIRARGAPSRSGVRDSGDRPRSPDLVSYGTLNPEEAASPHEPTVFVYVNGVKTDEISEEGTGAAFTSLRLLDLLTNEPRFKIPYYRVEHVLNRRWQQQLKDWDAEHPCVKVSMKQAWLHGQFRKAMRYRRCMEDRNALGWTMNDWIEAATARLQLLLHLAPTNPDVPKIAERIRMERAQGNHVIMVGHSEGTLLIAQAIRSLPSLEGHPIQVANSCVASLSLATPADRRSFGLDDPYNDGFVIAGDIIQLAFPTGWDVIHTPSADAIPAYLDEHPDSTMKLWLGLTLNARQHSIDWSYLRDAVARAEILRRLVSLHKECVQQTLTVSPELQTIRVGSEFSFTPHLYNQNGRELFGRNIFEGSGEDFIWLDKYRYRAHLPRDPRYGPQSVQVSTQYLYQDAKVVVPLVPVVGASLAEKDSSWWEVVAASNGGLGDPPYGWEQGPGYSWDGSPDTCGATETIYGRTGWGGVSYGVFVLRCRRLFTVTYGVVTDAEVAPYVDHYESRFHGSAEATVDPRQLSVVCGAERCIDSVEVVAIDRYRETVGSSGELLPGQSSAAPSPVARHAPRSSRRVATKDLRTLPERRKQR